MLKKAIIIFFTVSSVFVLYSHSYAFGIGAYGTIGGGNTNEEVDNKYAYINGALPIVFPRSYKNLAIGGGIAIDSCLAALDIFNYRLKLGLEQNKLFRENDIKMLRLHLDQIFGFGIVRISMMRWWLGPLLEARYAWSSNAGYLSDIKQYGGAVGVATGFNFNLVEHFTIGLEGGFKYGMDWCSQKRSSIFNLLPATNFSLNKNRSIRTYGYELYGQVSVFCRVGNDTYSKIRYEKVKE